MNKKNGQALGGQLFLFLMIFAGLAILLSLWTGLVWLNAWLVLVVCLLAAFWLTKRFSTPVPIPAVVWLMAMLLLVLLWQPAIATQWVPASADAVSTTAVRALQEKIPASFAPYSNVSFGYQPGFPLLSRLVLEWDVLKAIPDHLVSWLLAGFFGIVQLLLVFLVGQELFKSESAGKIAAAVFLSSKLVFENQLLGEYGWLAATAFLLLFVFWWLKRNPLFLLCFPVVVALHPGIALNAIFVFGMLLFFYSKRALELLAGLASGLLALPALFITYVPIVQNFSASAGEAFSWLAHIKSILFFVPILPFWIGTMLSALFVFFVVLWFWENRREQKKQLFWNEAWPVPGLLLASLVLFLLFAFLEWLGFVRIVELVLLFLVFWTAFLASRIGWIQKNFSKVLALLVIAGLIGFFSSSYLGHLRSGSKINANEILFSKKFRALDSEPKRTLFLIKSGGKMAELSNKVPFDANSNWFLPSPMEMQRDTGFLELQQNHLLQQKIIAENCVACIPFDKLDYIVLDSSLVSFSFPGSSLLESGNIRLYAVPKG